tara:strand:+ start:2517 stop:2900 length:384 start_codon:yes stop_codon:yes gene_type:complete
MFNIPLSTDDAANKQQYPPMIRKVTGSGYPKADLIANHKTHCEVCTHVVDHQFSWCELPCPRAGTAPVGWQVCIFCGTMRCDPLPVMVNTRPLQLCACTYEGGKRAWKANQHIAKDRDERGSWCHEA